MESDLSAMLALAPTRLLDLEDAHPAACNAPIRPMP